MDTVGIICEYNPFHNGHLYHINKCKEMFPDAIIVLVLNGYFSQRGEMSILTKEDKTKIALEAGVNLVIELPFVFGTQSADTFAFTSVQLLNELGVKKIVFGSEQNDTDLLNKIVDIQLNDSKYQENVQKLLATGINYPTAMARALNVDMDFNLPNDLLGISYVKAIKQINSKIKFHTIKRTSDYHDAIDDSEIVSATNIRLRNNKKMDISKFVPSYVLPYIKDANFDYFSLLKYKIISDVNLEQYLDVDEGLENRLKKFINNTTFLDELVTDIKSKRYTHNKICRMFVHILIGLTKEDNKTISLDYVRVLGFDSLGKKYLNMVKKDMTLPFATNKLKSKILDYEYKASLIYDLITGLDTYSFEKMMKPIEKKDD